MDRARLLALANKLEGRDPVLGVPVDFDVKALPKLDQEIADALGVSVRPFTTSIDAGLSLTDREVYDYQEGWINGHVGGTPFAEVGQERCYAATPALSLCAASLRALASVPRFVYAVGLKDDCGAYGMIYGPTENLQSCLDFVPDEVESRQVCYVLEFDGGFRRGTNRIVARWRPTSGTWLRRAAPGDL